MMWWSMPETYNDVRDLSRYMATGTIQEHVMAMEKVMNYCLSTRKGGSLNEVWDGNHKFKLRILARSVSTMQRFRVRVRVRVRVKKQRTWRQGRV